MLSYKLILFYYLDALLISNYVKDQFLYIMRLFINAIN